MKAICIHDCQFRGVLVKADTVLELTPDEARRGHVKASFRPLDGDGPKKAEEKPDERGMTLSQYKHALDVRGVPYSPTDGIDAVRKLFDRVNDQSARKGR